MSAPSASASSSPVSMANQEILATMGRIDIMLAQVRNSQSDQEKLRLSKAIGLEVVSFHIF